MPTVAKANALRIEQIDEFSLVPRSMGRPANEYAQISLTKAQEGGAMPPNDSGISADVQKAIDAAKAEAAAEIAKARAEAAAEIAKANERLAAADEREAFAKTEARIVSQGISKALAADFRTFEKSNPEAAARIEAEMARLVKMANNVSALTKSIGSVAPPEEGSPAAKLNKAVDDLMKADSDLTRAQAITKALTLNPSLAGA